MPKLVRSFTVRTQFTNVTAGRVIQTGGSRVGDLRRRTKTKTKLRGLSPHANYTDRAAAAGRWS